MPLINFSGIASGIDSEALIKATSDATRASRVLPKKKKIQDYNDTNQALTLLDTKLKTLQTTLKGFTTAFGGALTKKANSSDEAVATATTTNAASNGSYQLTIDQRAKNATLSLKSAATYTAGSNLVGAVNMGSTDAERTVTFTLGQGATQSTVNIVVTDTMTLEVMAGAFNDLTTKAIANIVNVGSSTSPDYRLVVNTNNEGLDEGKIEISNGAEIIASNIFNDNLTSQATDAKFTIDGIGTFGGGASTITRSSNTVSDVIPGVTFNLISTNVTPVTISVSDDESATTSKIQTFIDNYNDIVKFIAENNKIEREEAGERVTNTFGPLSLTRIDDGALGGLRGSISTSVYAAGTTVRIMADLGITTDRDGTLKFDSAVFKTALSTDPNATNTVFKTFADKVATTVQPNSLDPGVIEQYSRFNGIIDSAQTGNTDQVKSLNEQIAVAEASILKQEETMRRRFSRLEQLIGGMNAKQSALTASLASLGP